MNTDWGYTIAFRIAAFTGTRGKRLLLKLNWAEKTSNRTTMGEHGLESHGPG